jgi:hypothetical protein
MPADSCALCRTPPHSLARSHWNGAAHYVRQLGHESAAAAGGEIAGRSFAGKASFVWHGDVIVAFHCGLLVGKAAGSLLSGLTSIVG